MRAVRTLLRQIVSSAMLELILAGCVALFLFLYLIYAMLKPERF
jgi:K+-transporting ATPase KdpF subunit